MANLTGQEIRNTYQGLLKTDDNAAIGATKKVITDGLGNSSILSLGTTDALLTGPLANTRTTTVSADWMFFDAPAIADSRNPSNFGDMSFTLKGEIVEHAAQNPSTAYSIAGYAWLDATDGTVITQAGADPNSTDAPLFVRTGFTMMGGNANAAAGTSYNPLGQNDPQYVLNAITGAEVSQLFTTDPDKYQFNMTPSAVFSGDPLLNGQPFRIENSRIKSFSSILEPNPVDITLDTDPFIQLISTGWNMAGGNRYMHLADQILGTGFQVESDGALTYSPTAAWLTGANIAIGGAADSIGGSFGSANAFTFLQNNSTFANGSAISLIDSSPLGTLGGTISFGSPFAFGLYSAVSGTASTLPTDGYISAQYVDPSGTVHYFEIPIKLP